MKQQRPAQVYFETASVLEIFVGEYESENYRIVPDNEAECFDIYNKDGERLGAFSYCISGS